MISVLSSFHYNVYLDNGWLDTKSPVSTQQLISGNCIIKNNSFSNTGYIQHQCGYKTAVSIFTVGSNVVNNNFNHNPGISIWFGKNDNIIESNLITDGCYLLSDSGSIYGGRDWASRGNIIRNNTIKDTDFYISSTSWSRQAIYLDDAISGNLVEGNYIENYDVGILYGGGRDTTIQNNIIKNCTWGIGASSWAELSEMYEALRRIYPAYTTALWKNKYPGIEKLPQTIDTTDSSPLSPVGNTIINNNITDCSTPYDISSDIVKLGNVKY